MNRRKFFGLVGAATITPFFLAGQESLLPEGFNAFYFLTGIWQSWYDRYHNFPKNIIVSQEVFDLFESGLLASQRFTDRFDLQPTAFRNLYFKGTRVTIGSKFRGVEYAVGGSQS